MRRDARIDLTGLLDVLLIVMLAMLLRPVLAPASTAEASEEPVLTAPADMQQADLEAQVEQAPPPPAIDPQQLEALLSEVTDTLGRVDDHLGQTPEEQSADAVVDEFLRTELVLVQIVVSRDEVTRYRRYGEPWRTLPVAVSVVDESHLDAETGEPSPFLPRFLAQLEAGLQPGAQDGPTIYLFVPDPNAEPLYWAAASLRREIANADESLDLYYPAPRVP